jgi:hypothetical protein
MDTEDTLAGMHIITECMTASRTLNGYLREDKPLDKRQHDNAVTAIMGTGQAPCGTATKLTNGGSNKFRE